jgi:hypothetical protein
MTRRGGESRARSPSDGRADPYVLPVESRRQPHRPDRVAARTFVLRTYPNRPSTPGYGRMTLREVAAVCRTGRRVLLAGGPR